MIRVGPYCIDTIRLDAVPVGRLIVELVWRRPLRLMLLWQERASHRHHLAMLDSRALKDIGISPMQARYEAGKPFWRA